MNEREKFEQWWGCEPQEYKLAMTAEEKLSMWVWEAWKARASQPAQEPVQDNLSTWWAVIMETAASYEVSSYSIKDEDAKTNAINAIEYARRRANELWNNRKNHTSPPSEAARIAELEKALHDINLLRSSTFNYGMARVIACKALGIEHTDSTMPPSCVYTDETAKEASARAIADHNQITQLNARIAELEAKLAECEKENEELSKRIEYFSNYYT